VASVTSATTATRKPKTKKIVPDRDVHHAVIDVAMLFNNVCLVQALFNGLVFWPIPNRIDLELNDIDFAFMTVVCVMWVVNSVLLKYASGVDIVDFVGDHLHRLIWLLVFSVAATCLCCCCMWACDRFFGIVWSGLDAAGRLICTIVGYILGVAFMCGGTSFWWYRQDRMDVWWNLGSLLWRLVMRR
jgi:hypothetical protein